MPRHPLGQVVEMVAVICRLDRGNPVAWAVLCKMLSASDWGKLLGPVLPIDGSGGGGLTIGLRARVLVWLNPRRTSVQIVDCKSCFIGKTEDARISGVAV